MEETKTKKFLSHLRGGLTALKYSSELSDADTNEGKKRTEEIWKTIYETIGWLEDIEAKNLPQANVSGNEAKRKPINKRVSEVAVCECGSTDRTNTPLNSSFCMKCGKDW